MDLVHQNQRSVFIPQFSLRLARLPDYIGLPSVKFVGTTGRPMASTITSPVLSLGRDAEGGPWT
ncbi:uncharacterized protein J3R85_011100 [Psidium guajava]|nr:uncharacterized protein J3R85_011100 [Psidium guajava]